MLKKILRGVFATALVGFSASIAVAQADSTGHSVVKSTLSKTGKGQNITFSGGSIAAFLSKNAGKEFMQPKSPNWRNYPHIRYGVNINGQGTSAQLFLEYPSGQRFNYCEADALNSVCMASNMVVVLEADQVVLRTIDQTTATQDGPVTKGCVGSIYEERMTQERIDAGYETFGQRFFVAGGVTTQC